MKKLLVSALKYSIVLFAFLIVAVALLPRFSVFGNFQSLVVLSGSMGPTIKTGSIALVRAQPAYQVGDIVTFEEGSNLVTHRIVTISEGQKVITKGDANPASDIKEISIPDIRGKVLFSIPFLGYAANFAKTKLGFALFIILPALLIIADEIRGLLRGRSASAKAGSFCALILFFASAFGSGISLAYFSDTEIASGNMISIGVDWEVPEPEIKPGDVVINELMWMGSATGSGGSGDEWMELRNMADQDIDLSGWEITKKSSGIEVLMLSIPPGNKISANGYFLISEYDKEYSKIDVNPDLIFGAGDTGSSAFALANTQLQIKLYKGDWMDSSNWIDTADDGTGAPLAGDDEKKYSMERNSTPGDGTLASSWHTCTDSASTALYWDSGVAEQGTPGAANSIPGP